MTQRVKDWFSMLGQFIKTVGAPVAILFALLHYASQGVAVFHETVVIPIVELQKDFVASTTKTQERQAEAIEELVDSKAKTNEILEEISRGQHEIGLGVKAIIERGPTIQAAPGSSATIDGSK